MQFETAGYYNDLTITTKTTLQNLCNLNQPAYPSVQTVNQIRT